MKGRIPGSSRLHQIELGYKAGVVTMKLNYATFRLLRKWTLNEVEGFHVGNCYPVGKARPMASFFIDPLIKSEIQRRWKQKNDYEF